MWGYISDLCNCFFCVYCMRNNFNLIKINVNQTDGIAADRRTVGHSLNFVLLHLDFIFHTFCFTIFYHLDFLFRWVIILEIFFTHAHK